VVLMGREHHAHAAAPGLAAFSTVGPYPSEVNCYGGVGKSDGPRPSNLTLWADLIKRPHLARIYDSFRGRSARRENAT
jgi:hypothetical protein